MTTWWEDDPARLDLEFADVLSIAPNLTWNARGSGEFSGALELWPFDRPAPPGLERVAPGPCSVVVRYGQAFPASPPLVFALDPLPDRSLRGFTEFHILPNGALCLLRDADQWNPRDLTSDLLLKASGWHIEYRLLQGGFIQELSERGIVNDAEFDHLVPEALKQ